MQKMIPQGAMIRVTANELNDGEFVDRINEEIEKAIRHLDERLNRKGVSSGAVVITPKITIALSDGCKEYYDVAATINTKYPPLDLHASQVKFVNGEVLCQPTGANEHSPDQQVLFDKLGRPLGVVDEETGELLDDVDEGGSSVVGSVGR